jgi:hypothetical protein
MIRIEIETTNDAFVGMCGPADEAHAILTEMATSIQRQGLSTVASGPRPFRDVNGNTVATMYEVTE